LKSFADLRVAYVESFSRAALARCLYALGDFAYADRAHIAEIDLNPIKVCRKGKDASSSMR
jgi:hypothetical protein